MNFPYRTFGKTNHRRRWYKDWPWLHYSEEEDKVYCHVCTQALAQNRLSAKKSDDAFLTTGFCNWKNATSKDKGFAKHEGSSCHKEAVERHVTLPQETEDIKESMSDAYATEARSNRKCLLTILQNIQYLARQGLPLRGQGSGENSNFTQLLVLRSNDIPKLEDWLRKKKPDKYTCAEVQNELLQLMAEQMFQDIASSIHCSDHFSVFADETADVSNKEQLVICVRWVDDNLEVHEEFIGLRELEDCSSASLADEIKGVLRKLNLSLTKLRGQCHDGCNTMSGTNSGVAAQLKKEEPRALYTHCYGHATNLACSDSIKKIKTIKDAYDTVTEITKLVKNSPK